MTREENKIFDSLSYEQQIIAIGEGTQKKARGRFSKNDLLSCIQTDTAGNVLYD